MKITIEIDCETIGDFATHLGVLRDALLINSSKMGVDPNDEEMPEALIDLLDDNNCYGSHTVQVEEDEPTDQQIENMNTQ